MEEDDGAKWENAWKIEFSIDRSRLFGADKEEVLWRRRNWRRKASLRLLREFDEHVDAFCLMLLHIRSKTTLPLCVMELWELNIIFMVGTLSRATKSRYQMYFLS